MAHSRSDLLTILWLTTLWLTTLLPTTPFQLPAPSFSVTYYPFPVTYYPVSVAYHPIFLFLHLPHVIDRVLILDIRADTKPPTEERRKMHPQDDQTSQHYGEVFNLKVPSSKLYSCGDQNEVRKWGLVCLLNVALGPLYIHKEGVVD